MPREPLFGHNKLNPNKSTSYRKFTPTLSGHSSNLQSRTADAHCHRARKKIRSPNPNENQDFAFIRVNPRLET
jgi:hypothetical protein